MKPVPYHNNLPSAKVFNQQLAECWQSLQGGTTIAVYKSLITLTGSIKTAVFLSQLIYWTRVGKDVNKNDGWIHKTIKQMTFETGLTKREQQLCKDTLLDLNLIEIKRVGMGAKLRFKILLNNLAQQVCFQNEEVFSGDLTIDQLQEHSSLFFRRYFGERMAYHRDLVELTGCIHAAIMLSHMLRVSFLNNPGNDQQRAFSTFKIEDWQKVLYLTYRNQFSARKKLKAKSFISLHVHP